MQGKRKKKKNKKKKEHLVFRKNVTAYLVVKNDNLNMDNEVIQRCCTGLPF